MKTWLVCGGRYYENKPFVFRFLGQLMLDRGEPLMIVQGGATGADALAAEWALSYAIPCMNWPAKWVLHGRTAGSIRNQLMLDYMQPNLVVAFPGTIGTRDMVDRAMRAGIEVILALPEKEGR